MDAAPDAVVSATLDGAGGASIASVVDGEAWRSSPAQMWAIVNPADGHGRVWLATNAAISPEDRTTLLAEPHRPWVSSVGSETLLAVLQTLPDERSESWLRIVRTPNRLITICEQPLPALHAALMRLRAGKGARALPELIVDIARAAADRIESPALALDSATADLEHQLDAQNGPPPLDDLRRLHRQATQLRRQLARLREALERLDAVDRGQSLGDQQARWQRVLRETDDLVNLLDGILERLRGAGEHMNNRLSSMLGDRIYVLTLISAIALPLSIVTGLLGINVGGVPLRDSSWGFALVCGFLLVLGLLQFSIIRRLRWLPRHTAK